MTMHLLSIQPDGIDLCIAEGTTESDRADAIIAAGSFTDGDHGDELLRPGLYTFYVEPDPEGMVAFIGSRLPL